MNRIFSLLVANVGMGVENLVLLIVLLAGLVFYAKDFKVGLVLQFLGSGAVFMLFYGLTRSSSFGVYNYIPSMYVFFVTLVIMSLSFYFSARSQSSGQVI